MASVDSGSPDYEGGGLSKETNWWGAFVIGLAGTILVTGIAPVMVTSLGASAIPVMIVITITGYLLCLFLAEMSAMMPERTGGSPSYAYVGFKDQLAAVRAARERVHGVGVLARLVPGGAAEHDPGVVLHHREVQPVPEGLHPDPHADRLLDDRDLGNRHPPDLHPGVARHSPWRDVRHRARAAVDDPADAARADAVPAPICGPLGATFPASTTSTAPGSSRTPWATTGS